MPYPRMTFAAALLSGLALPGRPVLAADVTAANAAELNAAISKAAPGDVITLKNGAWSNAALKLAGNGSAGKPILVKAETAGQVSFTGTSTVDFAGDWITLEGIKFENARASRAFIAFQNGSDHCRLTNSAIIGGGTGTSNWIHIQGGTFNRIDHSRFSGMNQAGMQIQIEVDAKLPGDHRVDNCLFMDRAPGSGNGFETVRIGYSHQQDNLARATFERNLFLRCNGEVEVLSNKSTGNRILYNTFRDNAGEMTCRHGDKAWIEGNFFLRQERGIRLIGSDHTVVNNYIADMKTDGIVLYSGASNPAPTGYEAATNPVIAFNTIVNCPAGIVVGGGGESVAPKNVTVANNAFLLPSGNAMQYAVRPSGIAYQGNQWQGKGAGVTDAGAGLTQTDLKLIKGADGIYRPASDSPLKDAAAGAWADVLKDLDAAARTGAKDAGAFEVGGGAVLRKPLTEADVGPYWMGNVTPPEEESSVSINAGGGRILRLEASRYPGRNGPFDPLGRPVSTGKAGSAKTVPALRPR